MAKTQLETFNKTILPKIEKLLDLCSKHGIPTFFAADINECGVIINESLYDQDEHPIFKSIASSYYPVTTATLAVHPPARKRSQIH